MKIFDADLSDQAVEFLKDSFRNISSFTFANQRLRDLFGIIHFLDNEFEYQELIEALTQTNECYIEASDRTEYGDFQTNSELANEIVRQLTLKSISSEIVIEPTCGKGNFIIAALSRFKNIQKIVGIEIFSPYVWETKFSIIDFFLSNPDCKRPEIEIVHGSVFDFDFLKISREYFSNQILIIGNPPWVTNSKLGSLRSGNLPVKANFKYQTGLDAMTGKSNFDIGESITKRILDAFQDHEGNMALLVKNSVIKNLVYDQDGNRLRIGKLEQHQINSKKEFNASVKASMFNCRLNSTAAYECNVFDFYTQQQQFKFGWLGSKFVSNIDNYCETREIDGNSPFEWRQGMKHDCSDVMELERIKGLFTNKSGEQFSLEEDLVYGFLKSSDLQNRIIRDTRKYTIVTQTKVGQSTAYIQQTYPQTYAYLNKHLEIFQARKSSIYRAKPIFSIFGIGDYSFKPYKVAISGLYKTHHFSLVLPFRGKPVMLDDTCYFIGFDTIEYAAYSFILLNANTTGEFLKSITFSDAKRVFTKDILMRIDLLKLSEMVPKQEAEDQLNLLNAGYKLDIELSMWDSFIMEMEEIRKVK